MTRVKPARSSKTGIPDRPSDPSGPASVQPPSLRLRSDLKSKDVDDEGRWQVVVPREGAGVRLDRFLAAALMGRANAPSRAELQRWIDADRVMVGTATKKAADKVKEGERIVVVPMPPPRTNAIPEEGIRFEVLHVDDSIVVLDKPSGLVVHPAKGHEGGTLVNGLLALGLFRDEMLEGDARPGIVHRLDKGTSGVMVVARTPAAREALKAQFSKHSIERAYVAICAGVVKTKTYATLHGRHPHDRVKFTARVKTGKRAVTHVEAIETLADGKATLVRCRLETGRTHQIRVHLSEDGHAILGDPLYGKPPRDERLREAATALGHQALHATVLGFVHPVTKETLRFERPPPEDFVRAVESLKP